VLWLTVALAAPILLSVPPGLPGAEADRRTAGSGKAERPRAYLETTYSVPTGRTLAVPSGGDLQDALDRARPGDVITLQAGAIYRGPFTLPRKSGSDWIVIRTSAADADLPPPGSRIDPSYAPIMPKLEAASGSILKAAPGAHHFRLIGLEIRPASGAFLYNLVTLGEGDRVADTLPEQLIIDRCFLHGDAKKGARRGIALNSRSTAVIDSWLADFKEAGNDSQAIAGWNGPGPFKIVNNHLEGAGDNLIFGGETPTLPSVVPSDIEIRDNHFYKPMSWMAGHSAFEGTPWTVKNIFELKNARRVLVDHNVLENNWLQAQNGFAVLLTVRTERDMAPWAVVSDVIFTNNVVRHTAAAVNILGIDDTSRRGGGRAMNIEITNNLFVDIGAKELGGSGTLFQILNGAAGITIEHNTAFHTGSIISADLAPSSGLVFRNNIVEHNEYGVVGSGLGVGLAALNHYFPGFEFRKNVVAENPFPRQYPRDNFYPPSMTAVGFAGYERGDYRLAVKSPYHGAGSDGADPGVDPDRLPGARVASMPAAAEPRGRR